MRFKAIVLAGVMALAGVGQAVADTVFSNDFTSGIGANEYVYGVFSAGNGSVGTQGPYGNNQIGAYGLSVNLQGYSNPTLTYSYNINTERCCDVLQVYAAKSPFMLLDATQVASYSGYQNGTATIDLSPFASSSTAVLFRFASDGSVTGFGASIGNLAVTGTKAGAGVPAPIAGAGLPFLAAAGLAWMRRRRKAAVAA